jgi:hypothetical protein
MRYHILGNPGTGGPAPDKGFDLRGPDLYDGEFGCHEEAIQEDKAEYHQYFR